MPGTPGINYTYTTGRGVWLKHRFPFVGSLGFSFFLGVFIFIYNSQQIHADMLHNNGLVANLIIACRHVGSWYRRELDFVRSFPFCFGFSRFCPSGNVYEWATLKLMLHIDCRMANKKSNNEMHHWLPWHSAPRPFCSSCAHNTPIHIRTE